MSEIKNQPTNLPPEELMAHAQRTLDKFPMANVYFKFTCEKCGARITFDEPNQLFEKGECCVCGHMTTVKEGGYELHLDLDPAHSGQQREKPQ